MVELVSSRVLFVAVIAAPVAMALFRRTYAGKAFGAEKRDKKQRIFFAWTLIEGVNDSTAHARRLAELLRGLDAHVNLIPLNPTDQFSGEQPGQERVAAFQKELRNAGLPSTVRQRRGIDVAAGCGQLRSRASCSG